MKKSLFICFYCICLSVFAQLETANWYFGQYLGLRFENDQVIPLSNGRLYTGEGCATMSDAQGNLLFYTDGSTVYNKNHEIMLNGVGLYGNSSSTQSAIVIPFPGDITKYVIFTVSADDSASISYTTNKGFNFYYVDMTLDNGLGGIIFPSDNKLLNISSEKIAAVKHINRKDFWVVTHYGGNFYSYLVNETGVVRSPIISEIGPYIDTRTYPVNSRGYLTLSPNGKKIAVAHLSNLDYDLIPFGSLQFSDQIYPTNGPFANGWPGHLAIYDFNKATGKITNEVILDQTGSPYGVQFSPNSKVLYSNSDFHNLDRSTNETTWIRGELNQYNLNVPNNQIPATKRTIKTYTTLDTQSSLFTARGALQLALNQRIYYTRDYKNHLSHIKDPNNLNNPQFEEVGIEFPFSNWNIISRYGLPPFISSSFETDILLNGSEITSYCFGQSVQFQFTNVDEVTILGYQWDFGDGNSSTNPSPTHQYNQPGVYTISLTINSLEYGNLTFTVAITVYSTITLSPAELLACDTDFDGKILFNLSEANPQLTQLSGIQFEYFKTRSDAENNTNPIQTLYESTTNNEIIYVRVSNEIGCFEVSTIRLIHQRGELYQLGEIVQCSDENQILISLADYSEWIQNQFNHQTILAVKYYSTLENAYNNQNSIETVELIEQNVTIYGLIEIAGEACLNYFEFKIRPSFIPNYIIEDKYKCPESSVVVNAPEGYSYQWIGLSDEDANQNNTLQTISLHHAGEYQLKLKNVDGCERIISFQVIDYPPIEVIDVIIDHGNKIIVTAIGENLKYSLDGINWQSENVFVNLSYGLYKVYIMNENGCKVESTELAIFQITNFISPNQDIVNDKWRIPGLEKYDQVKVKIFNRYGKVLVDRILNYEREIWDGKYQNKLQPSDSYWYIIEIPGNLTYTGSLLLKNKL